MLLTIKFIFSLNLSQEKKHILIKNEIVFRAAIIYRLIGNTLCKKTKTYSIALYKNIENEKSNVIWFNPYLLKTSILCVTNIANSISKPRDQKK